MLLNYEKSTSDFMCPTISTRQILKDINKKRLSKKKKKIKLKNYKVIDNVLHRACSGFRDCDEWVQVDGQYTTCGKCTERSREVQYNLHGVKPHPDAFWERGSWKKIGRHNFKYWWTGEKWIKCG